MACGPRAPARSTASSATPCAPPSTTAASPPGERLPSERDLAGRLALSRSTVVTAYDTLRSEGVVESRQGSGTRIRRRPVGHGPAPLVVSPIYRTLIDVRDDVISLACATFPAHPRVAQAAAEVMTEDGDKLLAHHGYLPGGLPEPAPGPRRAPHHAAARRPRPTRCS